MIADDPENETYNQRLVRMYLHFHRTEEAQRLAEGMLAGAGKDKGRRGRALLQLADVH